MPTIPQLVPVTAVTSADEIPVSQSGVTHSVSVGTLLASMQPAIIANTGVLLGRISSGPGGPEQVAIGSGLALNNGTLVASVAFPSSYPLKTTLTPTDEVVLNSGGTPMVLELAMLRGLFSPGENISIDASGTITAIVPAPVSSPTTYSISALSPVTSIASGDLVAISQGGTDHVISYGNFLDGLTIDQAQPAQPATDTDTFWVAQGSSTMVRQTLAAVWPWMQTKLPSYKQQVVEITTNTTFDGTVHNGRILVCSQPVVLTPAAVNMGSGFSCQVLNLSSDAVTFGAGITTSSGASSLPSGQSATISVATYSGGTVVFASMSGNAGSDGAGTTSPTTGTPGQVTGVTATGPTTSSITLTWSVPTSGGAVSGYTVQYRVTGTTTWSTFVTGLSTTSTTVTGLTANTGYDFQVFAVNGSGAGPTSVVVSSSTLAAAGSVISLTWNLWPVGPYVHGVGSIGVNAHINPATAAVQFGFSTSAAVRPSSWTAATYVNTDLWGAYVSTPAAAGTWYAWCCGLDGSGLNVYPTPFTVT